MNQESTERRFSERQLYTLAETDKLLLVMVGLPARGKSFISKKVNNFFQWKGTKCQVFNVGELRRIQFSDHTSQTDEKEQLTSPHHTKSAMQDASFFDPQNTQAIQTRESLADHAMQQILHFFQVDHGEVAILDATNSSKSRRKRIMQFFLQQHQILPDMHVVFIESICTNEAVLNANIMQKVTNSPDYKGNV